MRRALATLSTRTGSGLGDGFSRTSMDLATRQRAGRILVVPPEPYRFSGAQELGFTRRTGGPFQSGSKVFIDGVQVSVTLTGPFSLTVDLPGNVTWLNHLATIRVETATGIVTHVGSFNVTQHPYIWGEWAPYSEADYILTGSGQIETLYDLTGEGRNLEYSGVALESPDLYAFAIGQKDGIAWHFPSMFLTAPFNSSQLGIDGMYLARVVKLDGPKSASTSIQNIRTSNGTTLVIGGTTASITGEYWAAGSGTDYVGVTAAYYQGGEAWVEGVACDGSTMTYRINTSEQTLTGTNGAYTPFGAGIGAAEVLEFRGGHESASPKRSFTGRMIAFYSDLPSGEKDTIAEYMLKELALAHEVTSIEPESALQWSGDVNVTINGFELTEGGTLTIGGTVVPYTFITSTELTAVIPSALSADILRSPGNRVVSFDGPYGPSVTNTLFGTTEWDFDTPATPAAWFIADADNLVLSGSKVASWLDLTESTFDVVQQTDSSRPTWIEEYDYGSVTRGAIDFSGSNYLRSAINLSSILDVETYTMAAVLVPDTVTGNNSDPTLTITHLSINQTTVFGYPLRNNAGAVSMSHYHRPSGVSPVETSPADAITLGEPIVSVGARDASSIAHQVNAGTVRTASSSAAASMSGFLNVGMSSSGDQIYDGKIGAIVIWSERLPQADCDRAARKMMVEWGIVP